MARRKIGKRARLRLLVGVVGAVVVAGATVLGVTAWGEPEERAVTMDEASRLALSRLTLYQASPAAVALTAAEGGGVQIRVEGVVDYRTRRGVGRYQVSGASGQLDHGLIIWDGDGLGLAPERPAPAPPGSRPSTSPLRLVAALLHGGPAGRRARPAGPPRRGPAGQPAAARPVRGAPARPGPHRRPRLRPLLGPARPGRRPGRRAVAADLLGRRRRRAAPGHHADVRPGHPDDRRPHRSAGRRADAGGAVGRRVRPRGRRGCGSPGPGLTGVAARRRCPWAGRSGPGRRAPAGPSPAGPAPTGRAGRAARPGPAPGGTARRAAP